jgi:hypothetical protein
MLDTVSTQRGASSKQITKNFNKRKRDISLQGLKSGHVMTKSKSSTSIIQSVSKKMKNKSKIIFIPLVKFSNNGISKILKYQLKENDQQRFIYTRLGLFDQQYCFDIELQLWKSYSEIGLQHQIWPISISFMPFITCCLFKKTKDSLYSMATTNDFELCRRYAMNYIENINEQLNQYQLELIKQSQSCPITTLSFDCIDPSLKEMVGHERKYLSTKNNNQLLKFKADIHEKDSFGIISIYRLTIDLVTLYSF